MRNPLKRLSGHDAAAPTLRDRLAATKARAVTILSTRRRAVASPDPALAIVDEGRRLLAAWQAVYHDVLQAPGTTEPPPEWGAACLAIWRFFEGPLLATQPITPAGAVRLAQFCVEFADYQEFDLDEHAFAVLRLIARAPSA